MEGGRKEGEEGQGYEETRTKEESRRRKQEDEEEGAEDRRRRKETSGGGAGGSVGFLSAVTFHLAGAARRRGTGSEDGRCRRPEHEDVGLPETEMAVRTSTNAQDSN